MFDWICAKLAVRVFSYVFASFIFRLNYLANLLINHRRLLKSSVILVKRKQNYWLQYLPTFSFVLQ